MQLDVSVWLGHVPGNCISSLSGEILYVWRERCGFGIRFKRGQSDGIWRYFKCRLLSINYILDQLDIFIGASVMYFINKPYFVTAIIKHQDNERIFSEESPLLKQIEVLCIQFLTRNKYNTLGRNTSHRWMFVPTHKTNNFKEMPGHVITCWIFFLIFHYNFLYM